LQADQARKYNPTEAFVESNIAIKVIKACRIINYLLQPGYHSNN